MHIKNYVTAKLGHSIHSVNKFQPMNAKGMFPENYVPPEVINKLTLKRVSKTVQTANTGKTAKKCQVCQKLH